MAREWFVVILAEEASQPVWRQRLCVMPASTHLLLLLHLLLLTHPAGGVHYRHLTTPTDWVPGDQHQHRELIQSDPQPSKPTLMTSQQIPRKPNAEEGFCEPNDLEFRFWMTRGQQDTGSAMQRRTRKVRALFVHCRYCDVDSAS